MSRKDWLAICLTSLTLDSPISSHLLHLHLLLYMNFQLLLFSLSFLVFSAGLPYFSSIASLLPQQSKQILINAFFKKPIAASSQSGFSAARRRQQQQQQQKQQQSFSEFAVATQSFAPSEAFEEVVEDLHLTLLAERERIRAMENEIRALRMSDKFLKERILSLEGRSYGNEKNQGPSASSSSFELMLEHINSMQRKQENSDHLLWELSKAMQLEKEKTSALTHEVRSLRKSEAMLVDKVHTLEDQVALVSATRSRQSYAFDRENGYDANSRRQTYVFDRDNDGRKDSGTT